MDAVAPCSTPQFDRGTRCRVKALALGLVLVPWLCGGNTLFAWGPTAHRLVNSWAIRTLPPEVRGFFQANRQFLIDHANDPVKWMAQDRYERKRHYMYLDKYGLFPYLELPHNFLRAVQKHGSGKINRNGLLPWHVGEYSLRLTTAMKAQNWDEVRLYAAALGHYVADTHNPLHTSSNYDGQLTGQTGLEQRFGSELIDRYQSFFIIRPDYAVKIDDPTERAFDAVLESHTWVNQIVWADRKALEGLRDYREDYLDRFYTRVSSIVMREINLAAHDTGSYWYTAWLNAGKPPLPPR